MFPKGGQKGECGMEQYENLEMEVVTFETEDVLETSVPDGTTPVEAPQY